MKHYNRIKNLILAGLVGFISHKYIVPSIPVLKEIFALAFVWLTVLLVLEYYDAKKKAKVRARRKERQEMTKSA